MLVIKCTTEIFKSFQSVFYYLILLPSANIPTIPYQSSKETKDDTELPQYDNTVGFDRSRPFRHIGHIVIIDDIRLISPFIGHTLRCSDGDFSRILKSIPSIELHLTSL